jgi:hypothetical protein
MKIHIAVLSSPIFNIHPTSPKLHNATDHFASFLMNIFMCIISRCAESERERERERAYKKEMVSWSDGIFWLRIFDALFPLHMIRIIKLNYTICSSAHLIIFTELQLANHFGALTFRLRT